MRKAIDFTDKVVDLVKFIQETEGHKTFSSTIHAIVANYYSDKYFSKYKIKEAKALIEPEEELTPEQACEKAGGKVTVSDGIPVCKFQITAAATGSVPLSRPDLFEKYQKKVGA